VVLVTNASAGIGTEPLLSRASVFDDGIGYVRVSRVEEGLEGTLRGEYGRLAGTNKLKGLVLDLRFAAGDSYAAAAGAADLFLAKELPLLDFGKDFVRSKAKEDAVSVPLAVLVNRQTVGSAEALAAVLRQTGAALLIGSPTAGRAMVFRDFQLKNGDRLRVASGPITLGDGSSLSTSGVKPDILVEVNPQDERAYFSDAFSVVALTGAKPGASMGGTNLVSGTNAPRRMRFNEAELVRERREGLSADDLRDGRRQAVPEAPLVRDPALARAMDVLKGLDLVRRLRH
jgi:C-terminal processing protease CtpA/Prc